MTNELWIRLRQLQTNTFHGLCRERLIAAIQDGVTAWDALCARLEVSGYDLEGLRRRAPEPSAAAEDEAARLTDAGITLLTPASPEYPLRWLLCDDPPLTLSVKGSPSALAAAALGVVGSREPTGQSLRWLEVHLAQFCREWRPVIVSGGARGVDQKAHAVALRAGVPTVMILPSGIECPYPGDLVRWFHLVVEGGGAIVSEYAGRAAMRKNNFHHRNRLIAAAGKAVLIVEARERSGTLITAVRAAEIGRPLWVVPGHPGDPCFAGNLDLLSENASLVRHCEDLTRLWRSEVNPESAGATA